MTCRSPRRENSAFSPATAVVSVLRKPGSTKIFATAMLAAVAIAVTMTASGLWDGSPLATIFDNPAAPATIIPNVSDVWSALDAVDSIMSSEWLILPAFAATSIEDLGNQTVTEEDDVTISAIITSDDPDFTFYWYQTSPYEPELELLYFDDMPTITFTAPEVDENTDLFINIVVNGDEQASSTMTLTILDSTSTVTNNPPTVNAGPNRDITKGSTVTLTDATARDFEDNDADLIILWTQNLANTVTITDKDTIAPTITVPATTTATSVTLTLRVTDDDDNIVTKTRVLTIQEDDVNDRPTVEASDIAIRTISNKKSSSSAAPIVDLNTLIQARIVDIPPAISEQISSRDASDPLDPILHNDTFDFPLAINEYCYLLDDTTNTLTPHTVTAGQSTEIAFTVYTEKDLAHFTLYLDMQGNDVNYADSDTYITYTSDGTVEVTDPHGYIADATITVTQEDDSMPEKKTVSITIYFDEPMGSTNMVAYMWNTDRKATFVKMIGALEVVAAAETSETDSSSTRSSNSAGSGSEPDASKDDQGSGSTSSVIKSGIVIVGDDDDDDDAQTLSLIRMWSGFASESLTDADFLKLLNLDYPGVDIPNWMMTELGALVSNGDVTVKEFRTALIYMLEMLTA